MQLTTNRSEIFDQATVYYQYLFREKFETMTADDDALHRHLVQVEICGAEAGKQVAALRDVIQRLKYVSTARYVIGVVVQKFA